MSSQEAIIHEGGRQFSVHAGSVIEIDRQNLTAGEELVFEDVRLITDAENTIIGRPQVDGARVRGTVEGPVKGKKLIVYKYRRRKNSATRNGHRQRYTRVRITGVEAS